MTTPPPSGSHLGHHLSRLAKNRRDSPLKTLYKYAATPGMIPLAGGMPHPTLFPYETLESLVYKPDAFATDAKAEPSSLTSPWDWLWSWIANRPSRFTKLSIPRYGTGAEKDLDVAHSLQYSSALGFPPLRDFLLAYTRAVHRPPPKAAHTILVTTGNTDAWQKCITTFLEPGSAFLVEGYTYPSAMSAALPANMLPVGLELDAEGIVPESLDRTMREWNCEERGGREKPHVLYTIPVGQNPTGVTMSLERKRQVYDLCCKHDVIICEDDPYWSLQLPRYGSGMRVSYSNAIQSLAHDLIPSFLRFDVDGRVIRLETFSKTIAPGARLGYFVCNELFAERLLRCSEVSTGMPCGFTQLFVTQLVAMEWKLSGYTRWLQGARAQYTARRDLMLDLLHTHFDIKTEVAFDYGAALLKPMPGLVGYARRAKGEKGSAQPLIGFVPPIGGMFIWLRCYFEHHPDYHRLALDPMNSPLEILTERFFVRLAEHRVLMCPGYFFDPDFGRNPSTKAAYFRISFSTATREQMTEAIEVFAIQLTQFMRGH